MASDEATRPLIRRKRGSPSSNSGNNNDSSFSSLFLSPRVVSLLSILLLITISVYFQWKVHSLSVHLTNDDKEIDSLQSALKKQAVVIERFNNSVTNSDVLSRLDTLETTLTNTEKALKKDLVDTQKEINDKLRDTLNLLNETVKSAEREIESDVDKVKSDVEQYVRTTQDQFSMENSFMVYQLAGTFTLLSCLISMWHMTAHLRRFNQPVVQRKILAILWMSPIYAITSWFSLVFPAAEGYLAIIKDFYEAYVIYQFLSFCIAVLGRGDREAVVDLLAQHADHLTPPFRLCGCCFPDPYETDRQLANAVLLQCQRFAMQFVLLRPLTSVALVVLDKLNIHGPDGSNDYRSPQFYIVMIQNLSVFIAFTGLLKFYHAVDQDLAWCRPFAKFLCIKGVVFMTFWQGLAIAVLAETTHQGGDDVQEWAKSAQNFLICLEMLLFSIAHFYCFPIEEWEEGYQARHSENKFGDTIALGDFVHDLKLVLRSQQTKQQKKKLSKETSPEKEKEGETMDDASDEQDEEAALETPKASGSGSKRKLLFSTEVKEKDGIQDILDRGSDVDDDEIEEATKRLLASVILRGEIDEIWADDLKESGASRHHDVEEQSEEAGENEAEETGSNEDGSNAVGYGATEDLLASQERRHADDDDDVPPNERTSLLGNENSSSTDSLKSHNEEILQPSIFTTVTEIARRSEEGSNGENVHDTLL